MRKYIIKLVPKKREDSHFIGKEQNKIIKEIENKETYFAIDMYAGTGYIDFKNQFEQTKKENREIKKEYLISKSFEKFGQMEQEKLKFEIIIKEKI